MRIVGYYIELERLYLCRGAACLVLVTHGATDALCVGFREDGILSLRLTYSLAFKSVDGVLMRFKHEVIRLPQIAVSEEVSPTLCIAHHNDCQWLHDEYGEQDPHIHCTIEKCERQETVINPEAFEALLTCLEQIPQGVVKMSEVMEDTVETSNNVGRIISAEDHILVSTHTRSFVDNDMEALSNDIANVFKANEATSERVMTAPAWQENQHSDFLRLTSDTFNDVLGWRPRMVAMHFVLEAGFFVQHYPGIEIASIGPRIVEPHSTNERVELKTIDDIWQVLLELLQRLA